MINASTKVPQQPILSSAGTDYDEECSKAAKKDIQKYIADHDVPETTEKTTETDIPLVFHVATQCCPTDFDDPILGSMYPQLHNYELLCKDMLTNLLTFYSKWNSL